MQHLDTTLDYNRYEWNYNKKIWNLKFTNTITFIEANYKILESMIYFLCVRALSGFNTNISTCGENI